MIRGALFPLLALLGFALTACNGDPGTGPVEVKWDRDACERCRMVLSDRHHSAQIRGGPADKRAKVYKFDDFGGAALWLEEQPWKDDPRTEFWVNDHRNGNWIEARTAYYVKGHVTPMEYGLGAQPEPTEGGLSYTEALEHVKAVEAKFNAPGIELRGLADERRD